MIAVDTSVLARIILRDSPAELAIAVAFLESNQCSVAWTVLIELCWVLERSARLPRLEVANGIATITSFENITVADRNGLNWALDRYVHGADFADMVHLLSALPGASSFGTFDRKLARQAAKDVPLKIVTLRADR